MAITCRTLRVVNRAQLVFSFEIVVAIVLRIFCIINEDFFLVVLLILEMSERVIYHQATRYEEHLIEKSLHLESYSLY